MIIPANKKVSICIPVYNCKEFVIHAVESALNQSYKHIEIVVSDNRSTDGTWELLSKYRDNEKIILHRNEQNIGMYPNFNQAAKLASGDFIKFLCADDMLKKDAVEKMISVFHINKKISLVKIYAHNVNRKGEILSSEKRLFSDIKDGSYLFKKSLLTLNNKYLDSPSHLMFYKKDFLDNHGFPSSDDFFGWGNDMVTFLGLAKNSLVGFIPEYQLHRRLHNEQYTAKIYANFFVFFRANINTINMLRNRKMICKPMQIYLFLMVTALSPIVFLFKKQWRSEFKN